MNDNKYIEESLDMSDIELSEMEDALKIMEQSDELAEEEITRLLNDDSCMGNTKDLFAVKKALDRMNIQVPDADREWDNLHLAQSKTQERPLKPYMRYLMAAAAILILAFIFTWTRKGATQDELEGKYVVYKANEQARDIIISSDQGNSVVLNKQKVTSLGQEISQTDELAIAYHQMNTNIVESHTVTIPEGKTFKIVLSDGSEVWLNAGSRLVYPTQFVGTNREVQLEGEAYFKIHRDINHPFIVKSGDVYTKVLGTEFNIRMKSSDVDKNANSYTACEVTLVKGKVSVYSTGKDKNITLTPGMQAIVDSKTLSFDIKEVDTDLYSYWKDGYFFFDDERLESIMKQIGSWYNVNVVFRNPSHSNIRMHFFCERNSNVSSIVEQLNMLQKVHATVSNNTIFIE